jgi:general secretion pathway protein J
LVELLVAMTLLGLIFVALFGGLRFGTRVWETGAAQSERMAEVEIAQTFLRRILKQAFVPAAAEGVGTLRGERDRLAFTAPAPSRFLVGGIYLYEVFVDGEDDSGDLAMSWMLYRNSFPESDKQDEKQTRTLLTDIKRVRIEYFGDPEGADEPDWYEAWEEAHLPNLIKLSIEFPKEQNRVWPELWITPFSAPRLQTQEP